MSSATPRQMRLALNGAQTDRAGEFLVWPLDVEIVLVVVIDILIIKISSHLLGCIQSVDWTGGLDYWTDRFSFKNAWRCSIMLSKVPL